MRISQHDIYNIRKKILDDLYGVHLRKISERKEAFLRKNLALEYSPYKEYLAKIPDHLLNYLNKKYYFYILLSYLEFRI